MLNYRLFYISVGLFWTCFPPFFIDLKIYARSVHKGSADGLYGVCCRTGKSENVGPIVPFSPAYTQSINCKQKLQEVELVALKVELRYWNSGFPSLIFPSAMQVRNDKKKNYKSKLVSSWIMKERPNIGGMLSHIRRSTRPASIAVFLHLAAN